MGEVDIDNKEIDDYFVLHGIAVMIDTCDCQDIGGIIAPKTTPINISIPEDQPWPFSMSINNNVCYSLCSYDCEAGIDLDADPLTLPTGVAYNDNASDNLCKLEFD